MLVDDESRHQHAEDQQRQLSAKHRPPARPPDDEIRDRKRARTEHRSQAHVTPDEKDDDEHADGDQSRPGVVGEKSEHDARTGGDAFAPLEAQKNAEHVSDHRGETD